MKKLFLLAALALPLSLSLTGCSSDTVDLINTPGGNLPKYANAAVNVTDSNSFITATKKTDKDTGVVAWTYTTPGPAVFTFNTLPGSDAINIVGYRIIKDSIDGKDFTQTDNSYKSISIYVPSGYSCPTQVDLAKINQSCDLSKQDTTQNTGITSNAFSLNLSGVLAGYVRAKEADVVRITDVEFLGESSRNEKVILTARNVISTGIMQGEK